MSKSKKDESVIEAPKFSYTSLQKSCRTLFGVSDSTFDGATANLDRNSSYSTAEVSQIIQNWLKGVSK